MWSTAAICHAGFGCGQAMLEQEMLKALYVGKAQQGITQLRELLVLFTGAIMFCTSEVWKKRKKMEK